jgi:hypothetical protein
VVFADALDALTDDLAADDLDGDGGLDALLIAQLLAPNCLTGAGLP